MSDIFLSYNREDQAVARRFAEAFEGEGFSVWWDTTLRAGEAYDEVTETALRTAKAVVVLWSPRSVVSRWVRAEATLADRNRTLVPCTIEPCDRPIMFELTQTAELSHWQGDSVDKAWLTFLADVKRFVAKDVAAVVAAAPEPAPAPAPTTALQPRATRPVLAVLPFINRSGLKEDDIFAFGMVEDIIDALSLGRSIRVLSSGATAAYRKSAVDVVEIARQSSVRYLLEGNVRRVVDTLRVTAQLIDANDGGVLWTQKFDRPLNELAALQEDLVMEVATHLGSQISRIELERALRKPGDLTAWEASVRSMSATARGAWPLAITEGEKAVALAPDSATAHATLAFAYSGMAGLGSNEAHWRALSHAHIARALELDASNPNVHLWVGWSYAWCSEPEEGVGYLEQAVRARPTNAVAYHGLGSAYVMLDRNEEALAAWETAERLAPNSPSQFNLSAFMGGALFKMGRLEAALERFDHSSRLQPPFLIPLAGRAVLFDRMGKHEAALAELRRARALNPEHGDETLFRSTQSVFRMMWHRNPDQPVLLATLQKLWDATKGDNAS